MRLGGLLRADFFDPRPVAFEFGFACLIHVNVLRVAQCGQRHEDTACFLRDLTFLPREHVMDQRQGVLTTTPGCLRKLQSLFKEAMSALVTITMCRAREATHDPLVNSRLETAGFQGSLRRAEGRKTRF